MPKKPRQASKKEPSAALIAFRTERALRKDSAAIRDMAGKQRAEICTGPRWKTVRDGLTRFERLAFMSDQAADSLSFRRRTHDFNPYVFFKTFGDIARDDWTYIGILIDKLEATYQPGTFVAKRSEILERRQYYRQQMEMIKDKNRWHANWSAHHDVYGRPREKTSGEPGL